LVFSHFHKLNMIVGVMHFNPNKHHQYSLQKKGRKNIIVHSSCIKNED